VKGIFGMGLVLHRVVVTGMAALFLFGLARCGVREKTAVGLEEPPIITSATYQHTLYNGKPQPIEARAAREDTAPFVITYFSSLEALERNEGGLTEAPAEVGTYYARIERPAGNGYARGRDIPVEYHIQKGFLNIIAEEKQEALYDGRPGRITARTDPPVELEIRYRLGEQVLSGEGPTEPGLYRVTLSYPGDERLMGASRDIEFRIIKK
jgi:hypothetical protein